MRWTRIILFQTGWMYTSSTLERLTIHWIDSGNTEAGSVVLGYLDAHGWGARVDASDRARARLVVTVDANRNASLLRGAAMDRNQLVEFAIGELEAAVPLIADSPRRPQQESRRVNARPERVPSPGP